MMDRRSWQRFNAYVRSGLPRLGLIFLAGWMMQGPPFGGGGEVLARGPAKPSAPARSGEEKAGEVAWSHLKGYYKGLGLKAQDLSSLKLEGVKESPGGYHVRFQQIYRGLPVEGGRIAVHLDRNYKVVMVRNRYIPNLRVNVKVPVTIKQAEAVRIARNRPKPPFVLRGAVSSQKVIFPDKEGPRLAWKVSVPSSQPPGDWIFFVDSHKGEILKVMELSMAKEEEEEGKTVPKGTGHPRVPGH
ncbi:MAG: hypothetical protein HYY20_12990 [Candidatus Tectomicrobia bacterium]|uniref:FTP domain-containing protein n=1 Tax=Tectimicrobiota bacterium TaxID=2528274 RepID=A0A932FXP5_UNCTE|nr:hypothetical protein [Candidatus Tectomicrobia bacterium]